MFDYITRQEIDPEAEFELIELLGQGNYGRVYKAVHKKTGKIYCAKIASIVTYNEMESFKKEIKILSQCDSPYIVHYFGSYTKNRKIWIILEYCDGGSLLELINVLPKNLNEEEIASMLFMILNGLSFLHETKKIHRDVKTSNILLTRDGKAKLGDFGVSTQLNHSFSRKISKIGTPFYMSPEVILQSRYNFKCDIWSLGITTIEMAEGEPPFAKVKPYLVLKKIITHPPKGLKNKEKWSPEFNDFVEKCLIYEPDERPSAQELLKHPFITKYNRGNKVISILINSLLDDLIFYRKKILESDESEEEDKESSVNNINAEDYNPDEFNNDNSFSVIINDKLSKDNLNVSKIIEDTGTMINIENKSKGTIIKNGCDTVQINDKSKEEDKPQKDLLKMVDMYGCLDDLSFNENFDNTLKTEETKMCEVRKNLNINGNSTCCKQKNNVDLNDILEDFTINELTREQIQEKLIKIQSQMNNEIKQIKNKYSTNINKLKKTLQFLNENQFLKNINEYKEYKKFAKKIKKRITIKDDEHNLNKNNTNINKNKIMDNKVIDDNINSKSTIKKHLNKNSSNILSNEGLEPVTNSLRPNHVNVSDYKPNNISIKKKLKF